MTKTETATAITRKDYMNDSGLHHEYFLQFATESTKAFILNSLTVKDIKKALESGDEHLNDIKIPFNNMGTMNGRWWWDNAPINTELLREAGEINSKSTHTCIAKAMAKHLVNNN